MRVEHPLSEGEDIRLECFTGSFANCSVSKTQAADMYFAAHETEGVFPLMSALSISIETKVVCSTLPSGADIKLAFPLQAIVMSLDFPHNH